MADPVLKQRLQTRLYEEDFYLWTQEQARALREGRAGELDIENIAEELETLGRSDKREIRSRVHVILIHLLKWRFQPEMRSSGWRGTLLDQRDEIQRVLADSPSLRRFPEECLSAEYARARMRAALETGLPLATFPIQCPFSADEILSVDFIPD